MVFIGLLCGRPFQIVGAGPADKAPVKKIAQGVKGMGGTNISRKGRIFQRKIANYLHVAGLKNHYMG
jgi:hypothetical protein